MATLAQIDARIDSAVTAIDDADYSTAIRHLRAAQAMLSVKPDRKTGEQSIEWSARQDRVDTLIKGLRQDQAAALASSSTAVRRSNVVHRNADAVEDYA